MGFERLTVNTSKRRECWSDDQFQWNEEIWRNICQWNKMMRTSCWSITRDNGCQNQRLIWNQFYWNQLFDKSKKIFIPFQNGIRTQIFLIHDVDRCSMKRFDDWRSSSCNICLKWFNSFYIRRKDLFV